MARTPNPHVSPLHPHRVPHRHLPPRSSHDRGWTGWRPRVTRHLTMRLYHLSFAVALASGLMAIWEMNHACRAFWITWDVGAMVLNVLIGHANRCAALRVKS